MKMKQVYDLPDPIVCSIYSFLDRADKMNAISRWPSVCKKFSVLNTQELRKLHVQVSFPATYLQFQGLGSFKVNWKLVFTVQAVFSVTDRRLDYAEQRQEKIDANFEARKREIMTGEGVIFSVVGVIAEVATCLIIKNHTR